jgi:hypothetical protein
MGHSSLERIAKSNEMIHRCRGKPEADMKVELLIGRDLKGGSEV